VEARMPARDSASGGVCFARNFASFGMAYVRENIHPRPNRERHTYRIRTTGNRRVRRQTDRHFRIWFSVPPNGAETRPAFRPALRKPNTKHRDFAAGNRRARFQTRRFLADPPNLNLRLQGTRMSRISRCARLSAALRNSIRAWRRANIRGGAGFCRGCAAKTET